MSKHKSSEQRCIILFTGDFCLAGQSIEVFNSNNSQSPWDLLKNEFGENSIVVTNMECALTDSNDGLPYKWANLKMPQYTHNILSSLDIAVLGNNHFGDFGMRGVEDTLTSLRSKGIRYLGYGRNVSEALEPEYIEIEGGRIGIVSLCCPSTNSEFLATNQLSGVAPLGMATLKMAIEIAHTKCDALITYLHWGYEHVHDPAPDQLRLARYAIDCGADAVIGCHSHTIQSFEQYKGKWIFYGLGNFLFDPVEAQLVLPNGSIKKTPIVLRAENRESIVVSFRLDSETEEKKLVLDRIQPFKYDHDYRLKPIDFKELTFDLDTTNAKLLQYAKFYSQELKSRKEPIFNSKLRNGILAYWYSQDTINIPSYSKRVYIRLFRLARKVIRKVLHIPSRIKSSYKGYSLKYRIARKWNKDSKVLPLTSDHRELYDIIHRLCWRELGEFPNLINCRDFNDRIQWLKLFDQDELIIQCSDKLGVRDYVKDKIGDKHLVKLYQVHDNFDDINFESLPKSFVLKTNHDSGTVFLIKDKDKLDKVKVKEQINKSMQRAYGWNNGEWSYSYIVPKIMIEEYLSPNTEAPPADYKFQCVNGKVKFVRYTYDRGIDTKEVVIDRNGLEFGFVIDENFKYGNKWRVPYEWQEMIYIAEKLSEKFKCVRIDLYLIKGSIYVGEMTFWPMAGHYKSEGQIKLGEYLDFDRNTFKKTIIHKLEELSSKNKIYQ